MVRALALAAVLLPSVAQAAVEPDEPGPFAVETDAYDFGDEALTLTGLGWSSEFRAAVYSPAQLDQGPFPLVLFLHGRHATCYNPATPMGVPGDGSGLGAFLEWPCSENREPIPSHEGYAGPAQALASHGYIVVSVSANGVNASDNNARDAGSAARAELLVEHLNLWAQFHLRGAAPFGRKFVGAVDIDRIGLMGHSRGGEGVASTVVLDQESGDAIGIDAALLLAPIDVNRAVLSRVALGVILPYCDGDVFNLVGAHYFDDARYADPGDASPKYLFSMYGANHNYFNTVWSPSTFVSGAVDDFGALTEFLGASDPYCNEGPGSGRLDEPQQQALLVAYVSAFFRRHLGDETQFDALLRGDEIAAAASQAPVFTSYLAPDDPTMRLDVNHIDDLDSLASNALGGPVTTEALDPYVLCGLGTERDVPVPCANEPDVVNEPLFDGRDPHTPGLGRARFTFAAGARLTNGLPPGTDVSELLYLQFRAAVDFEGPSRTANGVDFSVVLADGSGQTAALRVSDYTDALGPVPGTLDPLLPKKTLHGVRLPLADFEGIDRTDLASVTFEFDGDPGALLLSDLAFSDPTPPEDPGATGTSTGAGAGGDALDETGGGSGNSLVDTEGTSGASTGTGSPQAEGDDDGGCACRHMPADSPATPLWLGLGLLGVGCRRTVYVGTSTSPSARRAKRPAVAACTGSSPSHGQPPNPVRR